VNALWLLIAGLGMVLLLFNGALYGVRARLLRALDACHAVDRLGVVNAAGAFAREYAATAAVLLAIPLGWWLPRCRQARGARGPLLLIHGWSLNRGCFWLLRYRLLRDGWSPVCCFDYRSLSFDVEGAAAGLRTAVDGLARATGPAQPLTLIGHSLGGLVARYYARRYPAPAVRRIVTLGTPHQGTALARRRGGTVHKLAPGSQFMNTLNSADRVAQQFDVIAIQSTFDAMVLPPQSAEYPGAFNIRVDDVGHNALLFSPKIYRLLEENLRAPLAR
jgi:triacylglycerol lipase